MNISSEEMKLARERLSHVFPEATRVESHTIVVSNADAESVLVVSRQRWAGDSLTVLVPSADDAVLGYAVIDNVRGKDQFITYVLTVTPELAIRDVDILVYRESYGGEIMNSSWLRQFFNKKPGDELRPGREIRIITGATISSRSVTLGIRRVLTLLHVMKSRLPCTFNTSR
ncbi:MAG: FMN-binding protein [Bacteroidetes bacterium]|nr:FMN-binding protein [Bacteroidota bacterium]